MIRLNQEKRSIHLRHKLKLNTRRGGEKEADHH